MSLLSYQLQIKRYQKELGLSTRDFNKLDVKHSDINLLKQLKLLNPSAKTGFWGTVLFNNEPESGSDARYMDVYLAYNNVPLTSTQRINSTTSYTFNVAEADRLPLPSSTLQLKFTCQSGAQSVNSGAITGFTPTGGTTNPLAQENTVDFLVDENNYDNGECSIIVYVSYVP